MKALRNKVIVKIDTKQKERYALGNGAILEIERGYNFNLREDRPSLAECIDGENLPAGADVLINYLALEPNYHVDSEQILTNEEKEQGYKILSIPKDMVFCYKEKNEWIPCEDYLLTERIFKPYNGKLVGIMPEVIKSRLYIVKGFDKWDGEKKELSGKVCAVTLNSDYEVIWNNKNNMEERLIRTMHREILAVDDGMLKDLKNGKYLIGLSPANCKKINYGKDN